MTDAHTNIKRQDVYWAQVCSWNLLLSLVVIWRCVSLYILWVIKCSSLQSLAWVTGSPSQNSGKKDGRMVLRLKKLSFNQRMWVQDHLLSVSVNFSEVSLSNKPKLKHNSRQDVDIGQFFKTLEYIQWSSDVKGLFRNINIWHNSHYIRP